MGFGTQAAIMVSLAERMSQDWDAMREPAYEMVAVAVDVAMDLPTEVMEHANRFQSSATSAPSFSVPAGILAKYALGEPIPEFDDGRDL